MGENFKSEDILGFKLDRCISDTLIKTGAGLFGGIIFSVVLAKRRPWPLIFGTGFGLGMGISNCNNDFKQPLPLVSHRIVAKNAFLEKEKMKNLENNSTEHKIPDMGVFHREFLEANKKQRMDFNLKWYRSIVYIVYLSILVDLQQLYHRFYAKFSPKSNKCENVNDKKIEPNH